MDNLRSLHDLRRFWDELVLGKPASPGQLDPEIAALLRQVQTLPNVPPDAAYANDLREKLMHSMTIPLTATALPSLDGHTAPAPQGLPLTLPQPRRPGRTWPLAQAAIVLLLIAAMVAMYVVATRPHSQQATAPGVATPTSPASTDGWPMFRGNPEHNSAGAGPGPSGSPVAVWTYQANGPVSRSPAVVDGVVYLQSGDGEVTALDAATGAVRWQNADTNVGENTPTVAGDSVFMTNVDGQLIALDRATGKERWRFAETISPESLPTVVDGVVYVGSEEGVVFAVDASSGTETWRAEATGGIYRALSVSDDVTYFGTMNGHVEARNLADGTLLWQVAGSDPEQTIGAPAVAGDMVYAVFAPGTNALDAATGEVKWSLPGEGSIANAVGGGLLVSGREDGAVHAYDALTGQERWTFTTGAKVQAAPAIIGDIIYIASFDRSLYAVDAATGAERWSFELDGIAVYGPSVADGMLFVGTDAGTLYAIGGSGVEQLTAPAEGGEAAPAAAATTETTGAAPAAVVIPAVVTEPTLVHLWTRSTELGNLSGKVAGVAIDPFSRIWVCNDSDGSLDIFDRDGNKLSHTAGGKGSEPGQWNWQIGTPNVGPNWLGCSFAFAPDGTAFVTDAANQRVQVLAPDGTVKTTWSTADPTTPDLLGPIAISRLPNGEFLVTDWAATHDVIRRFSAEGQFLGIFEPADGVVKTAWEPVNTLVDAEGNVWVTEIGEHRIVKLTPEGELLLAIGGPNPGSQPGAFREPTATAVDTQGNIYVADDDNRRLQVFAPNGTFLAAFTGEEAGIPRFGATSGGLMALAYGGGNYFFVVDYASDNFGDGDERLMKLQILLPPADVASEVPPTATPQAAANEPAALLWQYTDQQGKSSAIAGISLAPDGNVWVTDGPAGQFVILSPAGEVVERWGSPGSGPGEFNFRRDPFDAFGLVTFAPDGSFYVADSHNFRIQHFDANRTFLGSFGQPGQQDGQFLEPLQVLLDEAGNLYVIDAKRDDVQKFAPDGAFLLKFGGHGGEPGEIDNASAGGIDADGNIWIGSGNNPRLQKFSPAGELLQTIEPTADTLSSPSGFTIDAAGRLWVGDYGNSTVEVFTPDGKLVLALDGTESGGTRFDGANNLLVDGQGNLYVHEYGSHESVRKYRLLDPVIGGAPATASPGGVATPTP